MFGYVRPYASELRVRDNEYYKAVYCGLCLSLGKCTGNISRLTLNYDFVFAALLRLAADGEYPEISARRCAAHPIKKRPMAKPCDALDFSARIGILLSFHKIADDVSDERGSKRFRAKFLRALMRGMRKRAQKELLKLDGIIADGLARMSEMEKAKVSSVDSFADEFGRIMSALLSAGLDGSNLIILKKIGWHLGRWLYIIDAADDYTEDIEKGRFNPLSLMYGGEPLDEVKKEDIFIALTAELTEIYAAFDLLDKKDGGDETFAVIDNILRLGMPHAATLALDLEKTRNKGEQK